MGGAGHPGILRAEAGRGGDQSELALFIDDRDDLDQNYPVACACGNEVNMYFGSPVMGRTLIRSLKNTPEPEDDYRRSRAPQLN